MITSEAIIVICAMIRMLEGICERIILISKLEKAQTTVSATLITNAVSTLPVTASAEHTPKICKAIGLLSAIGLSNNAFDFFYIKSSRSHYASPLFYI